MFQMPSDKSLKVAESGKFILKTPVSLLQETLKRQGIMPHYELLETRGASHAPTFFYRVSFNKNGIPFMAMGTGHTKREAKHAAAKCILDKLVGIHDSDSQANMNPSSAICRFENPMKENININDSGDGDNAIINPIGRLQEMCMSHRWPLPTYESKVEVGSPVGPPFIVTCTIFNIREVGEGARKKIAKHIAAQKMCTRLQEMGLDNVRGIENVIPEFKNIHI